MAGFRELLANEWDDNACETFSLNFPDVPMIKGDIAKLTVDEILRITGLQPGELDILDGSPPCQGFSTAGKRQIDDPRNSLFREYVRILRGLKPKVFVMENVSGMVKGIMKLVFVEILRELKASGYKVSARLLNAMYFNVPQSRQRMIFIGVREDLGIEPSHPKAESEPITVGEAWIDCKDKRGKKISDYILPIWEKTPPGQSLEIGAAIVLKKNRYFTHRKLSFDRYSNTIQKSIGSLIYHPIEPRGISLGELKRISAYPDKFVFQDRNHGWARIGNSVPPLFMRSIARHIRQNILKV
jgi:DNA (cytosine-5)-methyltransferase 1